ncbi:MAG TPA: hypothetical protein VM840_10575 [Actinomycetota bacterium]|jgi:hypothetical protein|nr:hypothetical protein [Actinomycetota bacterium]
MPKVPRSPASAVELLSLEEGQTVIAAAPSTGFVEALSEAVGAEGTVTVTIPPPELDLPENARVEETLPEEASADLVIVWLAVVPANTIRDHAARVADGGALWAVLPRVARGELAPVGEAEVKRTLLVSGWRDTRTVPLSSDSYAIRFSRRR